MGWVAATAEDGVMSARQKRGGVESQRPQAMQAWQGPKMFWVFLVVKVVKVVKASSLLTKASAVQAWAASGGLSGRIPQPTVFQRPGRSP